jgi:hypothetical protein
MTESVCFRIIHLANEKIRQALNRPKIRAPQRTIFHAPKKAGAARTHHAAPAL